MPAARRIGHLIQHFRTVRERQEPVRSLPARRAPGDSPRQHRRDMLGEGRRVRRRSTMTSKIAPVVPHQLGLAVRRLIVEASESRDGVPRDASHCTECGVQSVAVEFATAPGAREEPAARPRADRGRRETPFQRCLGEQHGVNHRASGGGARASAASIAARPPGAAGRARPSARPPPAWRTPPRIAPRCREECCPSERFSTHRRARFSRPMPSPPVARYSPRRPSAGSQ